MQDPKGENSNEELGTAKWLISIGRLDDAVKLLARVVEGNPQAGEAWFLLAAAFGAQKQFDDSVRRGERAVALSPQNVDAHFNLAQVYMHMRRYVCTERIGVVKHCPGLRFPRTQTRPWQS